MFIHVLLIINYKKKLKLNFLVLENNDAVIQFSWGIEGDG